MSKMGDYCIDQMNKRKHVILKLTVDEAIALNNFTMQLIAKGPGAMGGKQPLGRVAKKLLKTLNQVAPL